MSQPIIQFKAGKAFRREQTNFVDPAQGRGLVYLQEEDGLLHFYYKDLITNAIDDLIIFPGDASFLKVAPRVHVLKFSSSSHRHFFWHQDVDSSKDDENGRRINELIGGQEEEVAAVTGDVAMEVEPIVAPSPVASRSSSTIMATPAPAPRSTTAPGAPQKPVGSAEQLAQLSAILAGMSGGPSSSFSSTPEMILSDVLPPSSLLPLLPSLLPALIPFLPSSLPPTLDSLTSAIQSPEFRRSLASLDRALRTGALGPLVVALGLEEGCATSLDAFLEGVQEQGTLARAIEDSQAKPEEGEEMETD